MNATDRIILVAIATALVALVVISLTTDMALITECHVDTPC